MLTDIISVGSLSFVDLGIVGRPTLVHGLPLERRVRVDPEGVVFNLLNRAEAAARSGDTCEAEYLTSQAEKLFKIATSG